MDFTECICYHEIKYVLSEKGNNDLEKDSGQKKKLYKIRGKKYVRNRN